MVYTFVKRFVLATASFLFFTNPAQAQAQVDYQGLQFKKVMMIVFENEDYKNAVTQPYFRELMKSGGLLTRFFAEGHPSQGNYIAMVAGDTLGVNSDSNVTLNATHIGDLLEAKGLTWKSYLESYPGNCNKSTTAGTYARKHNPFISFANVQNNPARCANIVNASQLQQDFQNGTLPDFSIYVPDMNNDGHDTNVAYADTWLKNTFGSFINDKQVMKDVLLILTFDEGGWFGSNQIYTLLLGGGVKPGTQSSQTYNHYSIIRLIEDHFGLGTMGRQDARAQQLSDVWE